MNKSTLLTSNGLELPCVVLPTQRNLFLQGKEVIVFCQNQLIKGYLNDEDDDYVAELEVVVDWCIIPEFQEMLCDPE